MRFGLCTAAIAVVMLWGAELASAVEVIGGPWEQQPGGNDLIPLPNPAWMGGVLLGVVAFMCRSRRR